MGFETIIASALLAAKATEQYQQFGVRQRQNKYQRQQIEANANKQREMTSMQLANQRQEAKYKMGQHEARQSQNNIAPHAGSGLQSSMALAAQLEHDINQNSYKANQDYQSSLDAISLSQWKGKSEKKLFYPQMMQTLLSGTSNISEASRKKQWNLSKSSSI